MTIILACLLAGALARASVVSQATPPRPAAGIASQPRHTALPSAVVDFSDGPPRRAHLSLRTTVAHAQLPAGGMLLDSPPLPLARPPAPAINPLMRLPDVVGAALHAARTQGTDLTERALSRWEAQALAVIHAPAARPSPTPSPTPRPPTATATAAPAVAQVYVTGYSLSGVTATGAEAGPGICAVDPSYIPLGTRITIDGLGSCVAADTGPNVVGARIDVWVPTDSQAYGITGWYTARW